MHSKGHRRPYEGLFNSFTQGAISVPILFRGYVGTEHLRCPAEQLSPRVNPEGVQEGVKDVMMQPAEVAGSDMYLCWVTPGNPLSDDIATFSVSAIVEKISSAEKASVM